MRWIFEKCSSSRDALQDAANALLAKVAFVADVRGDQLYQCF